VTVLDLLQPSLLYCTALAAVKMTRWQPPFPTRRLRAQARGAGSAVRNRTSGNAELDAARLDTTRRRDFKEADARLPLAVVGSFSSSVARCFAWTRVAP